MTIAKEEIFAPVLSLLHADTLDCALGILRNHGMEMALLFIRKTQVRLGNFVKKQMLECLVLMLVFLHQWPFSLFLDGKILFMVTFTQMEKME